MTNSHAKLSPSASERWLVCSVAPVREEAFPDTTNDAAEWGTAAHAMAEHCLSNDIDAGQAAASRSGTSTTARRCASVCSAISTSCARS